MSIDGGAMKEKESKPKEEVLFDYDALQERERKRRSRWIVYAVFPDEDKQSKERPKKGYQI